MGDIALGIVGVAVWIGGALKISEWNEKLGVAWFIGLPAIIVAVVVISALVRQ